MAHGTPHTQNTKKFKSSKIGSFHRAGIRTRILLGERDNDKVLGFKETLFWRMVRGRVSVASDTVNKACNKLVDVGRELGRRLEFGNHP